EEKMRVERMQQMTPEKIAPLTVYLASDNAETISGQIFGVRNNEIFLFCQPRVVRTIHRSDGWTPESISQQLKGALGPSFTPLARSSDVFPWYPIYPDTCLLPIAPEAAAQRDRRGAERRAFFSPNRRGRGEVEPIQRTRFETHGPGRA